MAQHPDPANAQDLRQAPADHHQPQPSGHLTDHGHAEGRHSDDPSHGHGHGAEGLTEMLDLDAEVAAAHFTELTARIAELAADHTVRTVIDLGAGTGSGSFALLRRFPEATVTAIDTSPEMVAHLAKNSGRHGFADRIRPTEADLDAGWPETGPADLIWAASSMHHMADPDRVLRDIRATLNPGGLLAMIEMESLPRFLPDDLGIGAPGLEARCHAVAEQIRNEHLPHMGSDWPARMTAAGFTILESRDLTLDMSAPLPEPAIRYALATLRQLRAGIATRLSPDDQATLDLLLADDGPGSLRHRSDLTVRSTRSVWIAAPA